jgi:hypothetical protein
MLYAVGSTVDLTGLNTKRQEVATGPKKSIFPQQEREQDCGEPKTLYEVGTQYIFDKITGRMGRRIRVDFA